MDKYGLIGYPLGHSFSISYFNQKFADEGLDAVYENFEIPNIDALQEVLDTNINLKGLNVTIPYKEKVMPFLDVIEPLERSTSSRWNTRARTSSSKVTTPMSSDLPEAYSPCSTITIRKRSSSEPEVRRKPFITD